MITSIEVSHGHKRAGMLFEARAPQAYPVRQRSGVDGP
jgi:hypothetical protein